MRYSRLAKSEEESTSLLSPGDRRLMGDVDDLDQLIPHSDSASAPTRMIRSALRNHRYPSGRVIQLFRF
jgi:hypothetical protein